MIPQEEKILPPILWLIVAYEVDQVDYLVFLFHISGKLDFFHGETMNIELYMKAQRRTAMFASPRQLLTNSRRLLRGGGILAAIRGFWGWLSGWSRIWRLRFPDDLIL